MMNKTLTKIENTKPLSAFGLKLVAVITMLIDHLGLVFRPYISMDFFWCLRLIGRIAMPLYCLMAVEGVMHTRNFKKYALRMLTFAVISEIPFDMAVGRKTGIYFIFNLNSQNVMWTLLAGIIMLYIIEYCRKTNVKFFIPALVVTPVLFYFLCEKTRTDYGGYGILMIYLFYIVREVIPLKGIWRDVLFALAVVLLSFPLHILCFGSAGFSLFGFWIPCSFECGAVLAIVPVTLYGGKQGYHSKASKQFFYWFYSAHLAVLGIIFWFIRTLK